jgi:hypothetical protein
VRWGPEFTGIGLASRKSTIHISTQAKALSSTSGAKVTGLNVVSSVGAGILLSSRTRSRSELCPTSKAQEPRASCICYPHQRLEPAFNTERTETQSCWKRQTPASRASDAEAQSFSKRQEITRGIGSYLPASTFYTASTEPRLARRNPNPGAATTHTLLTTDSLQEQDP